MQEYPLMPKATAVWLVENTSLTFKQIAEFCGLHELEVQGIADGEVATGIQGMDPIATNQLERSEIERAQQDPNYRMRLKRQDLPQPAKRTKGPRYTPVAKRADKPDAIAWLLRNHPELKDAQISRLVGTTKSTIEQVRNRTHWNSANLQPLDPVTLGLCSQIDLDLEVQRASASVRHAQQPAGETLLPASETENLDVPEKESPEEVELDAEAVFAKLSSLKSSRSDDDDE